MAVTLTTYSGGDAPNDGQTHIVELNAGSGTTQVFGAIEFGQGNNTPAVTDTRAAMTAKIAGLIEKDAGYPILGDDDTRNDGRAADRWTWLFTVPEGTALLASNFIVTNYAGGSPAAGEPLLCHGSQVIAKRADQVAYVWVNITTAGAPSVAVHVEEGVPLIEQQASWRQESIALGGSPGAHPVTNGIVQSRLTEGEAAWIGAFLKNGSGGTLTRSDVLSVTLKVYKREREREWGLAAEYALDPYNVVTSAPVRTDPRWRPTKGYVFNHEWTPPGGWGSRRTRLEYRFRLTSGGTRTLVHEVEWMSTRAN